MQCKRCGSEISQEVRFCPTCGSSISLQKAEAPTAPARTALTAKQWVVRGALTVVLVVGIAIYLNQLLRTFHPVIEAQPTVALVTMYRDEQIRSTPVEASMKDGKIAVPLRLVQEHKLVRFFDPERIQETPLIAYVTPQGKLVTAMSRSEHCGSTDFYLSGNNIHCASCPSYWNMASLEAYACCQRYYPDPIPSVVSGDLVLIDAPRVRQWQSRL